MSEERRIYLDHAATTKLRPEALEAMCAVWKTSYGNPSSVHREGQKGRRLLEDARDSVANSLHVTPSEIYFTSGGTESDNWALRGLTSLVAKQDPSKRHIITSTIEHPAILRTCESLEKEGFRVTYLPVDQYGVVSHDSLEKALSPDTSVVSIMYANNEIGSIEPISELAAIAHKHNVLFHTDAVQAVGSIPVNGHELGVDALSFSSHKFGGPNGMGGLYIRKDLHIDPFLLGGGQEYGLRSGTENVAGAVGFARALESAISEMEQETLRLTEIRDHLIQTVLSEIPCAHLCGHPTQRLPGNAHFVFDGVDGEALLLYLNTEGFACSSGSACTSSHRDSSHVLRAIGLSEASSKSALRLTLGRENTEEEVLSIVPVLLKLTTRLQTSK